MNFFYQFWSLNKNWPPGKQFGSTAIATIAFFWKVETNSGDNLDNLDKMRRWRIQELSFLLCNWREHLNFHTAVFQDILFREITSLFLMCGSQEMIFPVQSFFITFFLDKGGKGTWVFLLKVLLDSVFYY